MPSPKYHGHPPSNSSDKVEDTSDTFTNNPKPRNYTKTCPEKWKRQDVKEYLEDNKDEYDIDQEDINLIFKNGVTGRVFPTLTEEKLVSYGLTPGGAGTFMALIKALEKQQEPAVECKCTFKYGRETRVRTYRQLKEQFSEDFLRTEALRLIDFPEGTLSSDLTLEFQDKDKTSRNEFTTMDQATLQATAAAGSLTIMISTKQKPFSSWTFKEFTTHFQLNADNYAELPTFNLGAADLDGQRIQEHLNDALKELIKIHQICPGGKGGNESERSLFVFEILKQVTALYPGFYLKPQKHISGSLGSGPVDYAIEHNNVLIMITEAKKENMDQGVSQCFIQLDTAGKVNLKRKREDNSDYVPQRLYGIVTSGNMWVFLRLEGNSVEVHRKAPLMISLSSLDTEDDKNALRKNIETLFGYILKIYQLVMEDIRLSKRARVEKP